MAKRAAQGSGTIRQKPNGLWEARVTLGVDTATGKQVQKSYYGHTQAEVRKKLTEAIANIDNGTFTMPNKSTVKQWFEIWQRDYIGDVKPLTASKYAQIIRLYIIPHLGRVNLQALSTMQIQGIYNKLQKNGLSPKTIKDINGVLHRGLQQAVEIGLIRFNPSDSCKLPRITKQEIKPLDDEQIQEFMKLIKGHKYENIFLTALFTGMRESELLGLQWSNVDFKTNTIIVDKQLVKLRESGQYVLAETKNSKARKITVATFVMKALKAEMQKQFENKCKSQGLWNNENNLVFTNELGGHVCQQNIYSCFKRIIKGTAFEEARFHDLRHSFAVASIRNGDDIKTIQSNLGHATASFTLDVYGHCTDDMKQESANRMEKYIEKLG